MMMALTDQEKAYFNTIRDKAAVRGGLHLTRMLLDGKPVGVILTPVYNRFTNQPEGMMPLSLVLDEETISRLTQLDGEKGKPASPFDLDPDR